MSRIFDFFHSCGPHRPQAPGYVRTSWLTYIAHVVLSINCSPPKCLSGTLCPLTGIMFFHPPAYLIQLSVSVSTVQQWEMDTLFHTMEAVCEDTRLWRTTGFRKKNRRAVSSRLGSDVMCYSLISSMTKTNMQGQ